MSRSRKLLLLGLAFVAAIVVLLKLALPALRQAVFYPKPQGLPPVVSETIEVLLARLQATLETNAPMVARALQPGLSDAQISKLEAEGEFRLSDDLRAFYRWHNGMTTNSTIGLLPGHRFVPLEEVAAERTLMRQQSGAAFNLFAGHRKSWLHVLDDGAGDGYFYDPQRTDAQGAFFFHFGEVGFYVWFPSLRNFLSGVIECYQTQAFKLSADGKTLDEDSDRIEAIWRRLAKLRED